MAYYSRTCSTCGFSWSVSSGVARKAASAGFAQGLLGLFRNDRTGGGLGASVFAQMLGPTADSLAKGAALGGAEEALRHCPACDSTSFSQRRVRGKLPNA